jgi:hypothetical protein
LGTLEEENVELKGQLNEIQKELREKKAEKSPRKLHRSSESDEENPRKRKSSKSLSSNQESNKLMKQKACAHEVLSRLREPKIEVRTADGKIEKEWY